MSETANEEGSQICPNNFHPNFLWQIANSVTENVQVSKEPQQESMENPAFSCGTNMAMDEAGLLNKGERFQDL